MEHQELKSKVGKKTAEIWQAYQDVLGELKKKETVASTVDVAKAKRLEDALKIAENGNIEELAASLDGISRGMMDARKTYFDLKEAIQAKRAELKAVHGLEAEVNSAVAVIAAKDKLIAEKEAQAQEVLTRAATRADEVLENAHQKANDMARVAEEKQRADDQSRKRIASEWDYDFARQKKATMDNLQDTIRSATVKLDEREEALVAREVKMEEIETELQDLRQLCEVKDEEAKAKVEIAAQEAKAKAEKSAAMQKSIIEKAHEGKVGTLMAQLDAANSQVADLGRRLDRAEDQVQAANDKVTSIATGALRAGADAATVAKVSEIAAGSQGKGK